MLIKKILSLSLATLALIGGLTGCAKRHPHHSAEPKTAAIAKKRSRVPQQEQVAMDIRQAMANIPKKDAQYVSPINTNKAIVFGINTKSDKGADNADCTDGPQSVAKGYWHYMYSQLEKHGDNDKRPVPVVFASRRSTGMRDGEPSYDDTEMFVASTNNPKLKRGSGRVIINNDAG